MEDVPLVTGSIRVPADLLERAKSGLEKFFRDFATDNGITAFSKVTVAACRREPPDSGNQHMPTPEEEELVTAARGEIVAPLPHPGFGVRLPRTGSGA